MTIPQYMQFSLSTHDRHDLNLEVYMACCLLGYWIIAMVNVLQQGRLIAH